MAFTIVREDLARVAADAIVVPAGPTLAPDGGVARTVAKAAGLWRVRRACRRIGGCEVGHAAATPAFGLPAKHIIHAVGPVWQGGGAGEEALLRSAYDSALHLALRLDAASVALPLLSAGTFGYPVRAAFEIAVDAIRAFLDANDMDVTLVLFDKRALVEGSRLFGEVAEYIDDAYVAEHLDERSYIRADGMLGASRIEPLAETMYPGAAAPKEAAMAAAAPADLGDLLEQMDQPFSAMLLELVDASGLTDAQVYKRANISRQHFSKMRNPGYRPTKKTVVALAVALELPMDTARDLLARAGFALSHSSKFDIIVEYFISRGRYDIFEINETLFAYDQPLLG